MTRKSLTREIYGEDEEQSRRKHRHKRVKTYTSEEEEQSGRKHLRKRVKTYTSEEEEQSGGKRRHKRVKTYTSEEEEQSGGKQSRRKHLRKRVKTYTSEEEEQSCRHKRRHKRMKKYTSDEEEEEKQSGRKLRHKRLRLNLKEEFLSKSLFICSMEMHTSARYELMDSSYAVQSINMRDLLTSSSTEKLELRKMAYMSGKDLPMEGGCGVLGSKIVFASGLKPNPKTQPDFMGQHFGPDFSTEAYAFDIHDPKQEIVKMAGTLNARKCNPLMAEFSGKLYVLSCNDHFVSFEVYDPEQDTWSVLPPYPDIGGPRYSYAIAGTKLFMSIDSYIEARDVWCFDLATAQDSEWRRVPSMRYGGGALPFIGQALVLDLPQSEHSNKKLLFGATSSSDLTFLLVYLISLDENQENITKIKEMELSAELPAGQLPCDFHFFHLGGNNVCFVTTTLHPLEEEWKGIPIGIQTQRGAALPFHFEFDISKVDMGKCFSIQFQPSRIFEYPIGLPNSVTTRSPCGCFVL